MLGIVMYSKATILGVFALITALTISGISVMGILQSSERVGSSGIITRPAPIIPPSLPPPSQPPPEPAVEIDVYMDPECTDKLDHVNWGTIESGGSSKVKLYVKNNGDSDVLLGLFTENWSPIDSEYALVIRCMWVSTDIIYRGAIHVYSSFP